MRISTCEFCGCVIEAAKTGRLPRWCSEHWDDGRYADHRRRLGTTSTRRRTRTERSPRPLSPLELGWLAGLLEGEGSIELRTGGFRIKLTMTDEDVVRRCLQLTGEGYVSGPYRHSKKGTEHHKPFWCWSVGDRAGVCRIALAVYPLLGDRRREKLATGAVDLKLRITRCGTASGARRHRARHEEPCPECREADLADKRARRLRQKISGVPRATDH